MDEKIKELLYRSFDETLKPEESETLEQALANSDELIKEKQEIATLRAQLYKTKSTQFKPFFAEHILNKIQASSNTKEEDTFFDSLFVLFRPVAIAAAVLIIIVAGYNVTASGQISLEGALGIPEVTLDDAYDTSLAVVMEEER